MYIISTALCIMLFKVRARTNKSNFLSKKFLVLSGVYIEIISCAQNKSCKQQTPPFFFIVACPVYIHPGKISSTVIYKVLYRSCLFYCVDFSFIKNLHIPFMIHIYMYKYFNELSCIYIINDIFI